MDPEDVSITTSDSDIIGNPNFVPRATQATASLNVTDITTASERWYERQRHYRRQFAKSGPNGGSITVSSAITATGSGSAYPLGVQQHYR